jgi:dTDP-4-dehydrorhamnose reductase
MKRIAVLGANGQLGTTIKFISNNEEDVFIFLSKDDVDITDKQNISNIFKHLNLDYCINCAAYTNVEGAENNVDIAFAINAKGAKNIAEICESENIKLIHVSTDYVFDGKKTEPYTTYDETNPISQYGKSKLAGELFIQKALKEHYIIRTSWLYSLFGKNFLKTIVSKIENNETLSITTEEQGTPTSCIDLAAFIIHIIKTDSIPYGIYNFSANGSTTWFGFAQEIVRNLDPKKVDAISPTDHFKTLAKRPKYSVLNLKKTENVYRVLDSWQVSVGTVVKHYLNKLND